MKKLFLICCSLLLLAYLSIKAEARRNRVVNEDDDDEDDEERKPWYENVMQSKELFVDSLLKCGQKAWDWKGKYRVPDVLGYVTPWNGKGYEVAEGFASQINLVSPVWYQIRGQAGNLELTGGHDYDGDWIKRVKKAGELGRKESCTVDNDDDAAAAGNNTESTNKIVPRVLWEVEAFCQPDDVPVIISLLANEVVDKGYDGFTLEFPINNAFIDELTPGLKAALGPKSMLIVAIPSYQMPSGNGRKEYHMTPATVHRLATSIDRLSLMTYDYAKTSTRFPNAPLHFVKESVLSICAIDNKKVLEKILIGIPWYGFDNGQPILGHDLIKHLEMNKDIEVIYDGHSHEHAFVIQDGIARHFITFPTPLFVAERMELAKEMGVAGIAIWELGQGLACLPGLL